MRYLSVCSGVEAATVAWHHMGWEPVAFSEIEKFPSAVLAHHYPSVPNWGDMTKFQEWPDACGCISNRQHELLRETNRAFDGIGRKERSAIHFEQSASSCGGNRSSNKGHICEVCNGTIVDVLVGGTPCQSFSVAGLRKGLADPRGNLMLTFGAIAQRYRPQWLVWENVPGVLSSNGGRDFGTFLGMLGQLGYGFAYRVLDAQFFGVAQRRRRVFVVGYLGDWHRAAAVLFERHSLSGHPAPSRQARKGTAGGAAAGAGAGRWPAEVSPTLNAHFGSKQGLEDQHIAGGGGCLSPPVAMCLITKTRLDSETETLIPVAGGGFDVPHTFKLRGGCEGGGKGYLGQDEQAFTLAATQDQFLAQPITFGAQMSTPQTDTDMVQTLQAKNPMAVAFGGDIARSLTARHDSSPCADRGMDVVAVPFGVGESPEVGHCLRSGASKADKHESTTYVAQPIGLDEEQNARVDGFGTLKARMEGGGFEGTVMTPAMQVRRLTPVECERLQGFPDGYTAIPWRNKPASECPDGPRYKALGNSMAVPVMRWIGERINQVQQL